MYITQSRDHPKVQGAIFLGCHIWHRARNRLRSCQRPPFDLASKGLLLPLEAFVFNFNKANP
jgi:hypothetical protein